MKACSRCKRKKPLNDFHRRKASKDGRQPLCKVCNGKQMKKYYRRNPVRYKARNARIKDELTIFVYNFLRKHPCKDCGEDDPVVLDFDHVSGTKTWGISQMIHNYKTKEAIEAEMKKCEVRCSNCHRKVTAKRGNFRRYRLRETSSLSRDKG